MDVLEHNVLEHNALEHNVLEHNCADTGPVAVTLEVLLWDRSGNTLNKIIVGFYIKMTGKVRGAVDECQEELPYQVQKPIRLCLMWRNLDRFDHIQNCLG